MAGKDRFMKKPDMLPILGFKKNKLYDLINSGEFIKPIKLPGVKMDLYSFNELQEWMKLQKELQKQTPSFESPNSKRERES